MTEAVCRNYLDQLKTIPISEAWSRTARAQRVQEDALFVLNTPMGEWRLSKLEYEKIREAAIGVSDGRVLE